MSNKNQLFPTDNEQNDIVIYCSKDGKVNVVLMTHDGKVGLNQMQIAKFFGTSKQSVGQYIANILKDKELDANPVVKYFFTTASDGKSYKVIRQWATQHLSEYLVKGFTMDDERLKNPDGALTISMRLETRND